MERVRITVENICGEWWLCGRALNGPKTGWIRFGPTPTHKKEAYQTAIHVRCALCEKKPCCPSLRAFRKLLKGRGK